MVDHGACDRFLIRNLHKTLENYTLACWDQLGSGKSYSKNIKKEDMTIDNFVEDMNTIVDELLEVFDKKKITILAHSWGTIPGSLFVNKYPQKVERYIGCGQMISPKEAEEVSYRNLVNKIDDPKIKERLINMGAPVNGMYKDLKTQLKKTKINQMYKGSVYNINKENKKNLGLRMSIFLEYNAIDIIKYFKGAIFSWHSLKDELFGVDLRKEIKYFRVPAYIISGKFDNVTPQEMVSNWIDLINKNNITQIEFEKSSHSPHMEEPILFNEYMKKIMVKKYFRQKVTDKK